mmetsp:Transcript_4154/g.7464  ORF Transcript_4154/g.7464 Transcript_4154/m.7464 type:complete len:89 (-) Transcript_4154:925-1191(-)
MHKLFLDSATGVLLNTDCAIRSACGWQPVHYDARMFQHVLVTFNFTAQGKVVKSQQSASKHKQAHILATCAAWAALTRWSKDKLPQRY